MSQRSTNTFDVVNDTIYIMKDNWKQTALATYRKDYYDELKSHVWSLKNGYPSNATLGGGLHRYMMAKWYGEDVLNDLTKKGYVVDHMNNNHMDCRICNLEFLKHNRNVAKGQQFDKEAAAMRYKLAINLFKDFSTGCYQITIGCNDCICSTDKAGNIHYINAIKLLYDCDYSLVVLDAESIIAEYEASGGFSTKSLHCCDQRIDEAENIELTEEEKKQPFVIRDGIPYLVLGNEKVFLESVHFAEGWVPPSG